MASINGYLEATEFVAGDEISIADIYTVTVVAQHKVLKFDRTPYPKLQAWFEKVSIMPGVKEWLEEVDGKFSSLQQSIMLKATR